MDLTHLDMAEAVADVAVGACQLAAWSTGGRVETVERTPRGLSHRVYNRLGQCIAASTISIAEAQGYVRLARRSAA